MSETNSRDLDLERQHNFGIVSEGKLYRSAQPDEKFLVYIKGMYGVKIIVSLRTSISEQEERFCSQNNIILQRFSFQGATWPSKINVRNVLQFLKEQSNHPILIHCLAGQDRTSAMVALYRIAYESWSLQDALTEMRQWKANPFWYSIVQAEAGHIAALLQ